MDILDAFDKAMHEFDSRVHAVGPDQWGSDTPCTDWSVRDLVNHLTAEHLWAPELFAGKTLADVGDRFDGDVLGDDPAATALDAARAAVSAVDARLPEGGTVSLSYGEEQLEEYVRQLAADHLVHGWDLAVALGDTPRLDSALVSEVAAWFADREEIYRTVGAVGPRSGTYDDAQDELIAGFGRDPAWGGGARGA